MAYNYQGSTARGENASYYGNHQGQGQSSFHAPMNQPYQGSQGNQQPQNIYGGAPQGSMYQQQQHHSASNDQPYAFTGRTYNYQTQQPQQLPASYQEYLNAQHHATAPTQDRPQHGSGYAADVDSNNHNTTAYSAQSQPYQQQAPRNDYSSYGQPQHQTFQYSADPPDKGFAGALAGGAAGAYGGHQLSHGVIGGIEGAVAGAKLEDHARKDKKDKRKKNKDKHGDTSDSSSSDSSDDNVKQKHRKDQQHAAVQSLAGNFSSSATSITLDATYDLIASCRAIDGHTKLSSISLNEVLTNDWGSFKWVERGGNFGASARNVKLVEAGRVLQAELNDGAGGWRRAQVLLDERIGNSDGELAFV